MNGGLETTFATLAATKNEAATSLLLDALDHADRGIQNEALRSLVLRRSPHGHRELLRRWHQLSERHKVTISEQGGRMVGALRDAILSADTQLAENGLDAVLRLREYDLVSALLTAAEDKANPRAQTAARAVLALCEMLYEEAAAPRDYRIRRDPQMTRKYIATSLEESVRRYDQHQRSEILEAFLLLTSCHSALLRQLLKTPHGKAYRQIVHLLQQSTRPGLQELLLSYLDDPQPPTAVHAIVSRRRDVPFLRRLFARFGPDLSKPLRLNARRIESFSWLNDGPKIFKALSDEEQQGVIYLLMAAGINRLETLEVVKFMVREGGCLARQAASAVLAEFHGAEANQLVLDCLQDDDAQVRANVVRQLRDRGIPGAMQRLLELINSPDEVVSEAARDSLSEFNFERLLASFDLLSEDVAQSTGRLVKCIDRGALKKLLAEFESPSRTRRLRALAISVAMGAVGEVERELIRMLSDADHYVRSEAARALAQCDTPTTRQALRELLLDRSPSVQEAAERALQSFAESSSEPQPPPPPLTGISKTSADLLRFSQETPS